MANFGRFNSVLFNSGSQKNVNSTGLDTIIFNGFGLQNKHFITTEVNFWNMPSIQILNYTNPKTDGGALLDRFYKQRTITISGHILADSFEDTDKKIDALKKALGTKQGYLDFRMPNGVYRRILCTLTNSDIIDRKHYDTEHGTYALTFRAENPFWSEKKRESVFYTGVNDEINEYIFNSGSEYSNPIINILVNSASNCDTVILKIGEDTITVNHTLNSTDILDINTEEKIVRLGTTSIDFNGKFPRLEAGTNRLTLQANGTFNFDVSILYSKNYL